MLAGQRGLRVESYVIQLNRPGSESFFSEEGLRQRRMDGEEGENKQVREKEERKERR